MRLQRQAPDPLYVQLRDSLTADIRAGRYITNQRLPSERDLSEHFQVSRMTARQALLELARDGVIYTRSGKGTFVAGPKIDQQLRTLTSFSHDVVARGGHPASQVLEAGTMPAPAEAASALRLEPGAEIVRLTRLRLADNLPLCIEIAHLPLALCPNLLAHDFARESLYAVLQNDYGLALAQAEQTIEAGLAGPRELDLLRLVAPAAVLRIQRTTLSTTGVAVEYVRSTYRAERYKFRLVLR
jgi:GntR family transcriptional regulator